MNNIEEIRMELLALESMAFAYREAYQGGTLTREERELAEFFLNEIWDKIAAVRQRATELTEAAAKERATA